MMTPNAPLEPVSAYPGVPDALPNASRRVTFAHAFSKKEPAPFVTTPVSLIWEADGVAVTLVTVHDAEEEAGVTTNVEFSFT